MPNPSEIAVVTALGQRYETWELVEVHRSFGEVIDHAMLTVSEISTPSATWTSLKLKPGDPAQVFLAGQKVLDGEVYLRQAIYNKESHGVQIGIKSNSHPIIVGTVDVSPGQYIAYTLQQIASAVFGKVGVGFKIIGSPSGADKIFPRVSEIVGESRFNFIKRLCEMRNLHMIDDGQGGIQAVRGPNAGIAAVLQEGKNILRARLILKNDDQAGSLQVVGQNFNPTSGDYGRNPSATVTIPPFFSSSRAPSQKIPASHPGDSQDMALAANHEADWMAYQSVDGDITVQGWMLDNGSLWFDHIQDRVTVNSPMLLPGDSMTFMIKGVIHKQSNEDGTTTDILLCRQDGVGASGAEPLRAGDSTPFPSAPAAQPSGSDS